MKKKGRKGGKGGNYTVGYAKTPVHTRFQPGQTGNAKGRPPNRDKTPPTKDGTPSEDLVLKLMHQQIPVLDGGVAKRVSRLETVVRGLAGAGGKGNTRAAKILLDYTFAIERRQAQAELEALAQLVQMKQEWRDLCAQYARAGMPRPVRIPDPDDLILDVVTGTGRIVGPKAAAEAKAWDFRETAREGTRRGIAAIQKAAREADPFDVETYRYELEHWDFHLTLLECSEPDKAARRQPGFDYDAWISQAQRRLKNIDASTALHLPLPERTAQIFFQAYFEGVDLHPHFGEAYLNGLRDIFARHLDPSRIAGRAA